MLLQVVLVGVILALAASQTKHFADPTPPTTPGLRPVVKSLSRGSKTKGEAFDDLMLVNSTDVSIVGICSLNISHSDKVNGIQPTYLLSNSSLLVGPWHGRDPNINSSSYPTTLTFIALGPDEYVAEISGKVNQFGWYMGQLNISTVGPYVRKVYGPFGSSGDDLFIFYDSYMVAFHGRKDATTINALGVYQIEYLLRSPVYFSVPGYPGYFDDNLETVPPVIGISKLHIWHGVMVDGLQMEYILLGGSTRLGKLHGNDTVSYTTLTMDRGEQIVELKLNGGNSLYDFLNQISLSSVKPGGVATNYGPFGTVTGSQDYSVHGNIFGFMGNAYMHSQWVSALGARYYNTTSP